MRHSHLVRSHLHYISHFVVDRSEDKFDGLAASLLDSHLISAWATIAVVRDEFGPVEPKFRPWLDWFSTVRPSWQLPTFLLHDIVCGPTSQRSKARFPDIDHIRWLTRDCFTQHRRGRRRRLDGQIQDRFIRSGLSDMKTIVNRLADVQHTVERGSPRLKLDSNTSHVRSLTISLFGSWPGRPFCGKSTAHASFCALAVSPLSLPTTNGRDLSGNCHFLTISSFGYTG